MKQDYISTDRLILRHYLETDRQKFIDLNRDPIARAYMGGPKSKESVSQLFDQFIDENNEIGKLTWAVLTKQDGIYIGHAFFTNIEKKKNPEIGYIFLPQYWGKGYATEVARKLVWLGLNTFNFSRITATVDIDHQASRCVLEKAGLKFISRETDDEGPYHLFAIDAANH